MDQLERLKKWQEENPLKKWLKKTGRTQAEIAAFCGVANYTVIKWVSGTSYPNEENLNSLNVLTGKDMAAELENWVANKPV